METLALDEHNNFIIRNGNLYLKKDIVALAQDIKNRVGLCLGENRFDTTEGIDFDNKMLGKFGGVNYYRETIRNRIEGNEEVEGVRKIVLEKVGTQLTITADVESIYGMVQI